MTNDAKYDCLIEKLKCEKILENNTRELVDWSEEFDPLVELSVCKEKYLTNERLWYESQSLNINTNEVIADNEVWKKCATKDGYINSNYGWILYSEDNYNQYTNAVKSLLQDKLTRQSVCVYTRPSIQIEHNDGIHANKDMICTFATQHLIRDNRLEYFVYMRSNDARFGLPYDLAWHQHVYRHMYNDLTTYVHTHTLEPLRLGKIHWHATSIHLYVEEKKKHE